VFAESSGITITVEPVVPVSSAVMPYLWLDTGNAGPVVDALRGADHVDSVTVIDEMETRQLLKIEWDHDPDGLVSILLDTEAVVLEAAMEGAKWVFRLRFRGYDALSTFSRRCREQGIELQLQQLYSPTRSMDDTRYDLTDEQQEVLGAALEHGYFEVPRETTLDDLGDKLGISDSAASQRLRRGLATLLEDMHLNTNETSD